ncbi:MAG: phosphopyruvate hydratase [Gammaproteobacteria bacterium]
MSKIAKIEAIQILDSRGVPTVSARTSLDSGIFAYSMVPSGASTGSREAIELRDKESSFNGKSVTKAVNNINSIINQSLFGQDVLNQDGIDALLNELDGSKNKANLGANAILAVSLGSLKSAAIGQNMQLFQYVNSLYKKRFSKELTMNLPIPMMNIINGGEHANNNIDIQEFMIMPIGANSFKDAVMWCTEIYQALKSELHQKKLSTAVGDEGGFAPNLTSNKEALDLIERSVKIAGYEFGEDIAISLDCAASEFYQNGRYVLQGDKASLTSTEFALYLNELLNSYPIVSIEDGMDENDRDGWKILTDLLGAKCNLVGDDLFVTNVEELQKGIDDKIANAILVKINQIGTISETLDTINLAKENNFTSIISHRSGETEDTSISDLAVGLGVGQIKTGAPCRSDRNAKYNRLLWIENDFSDIKYAKFNLD